ncbi:hypothetical protein [Sulfobacillus thermosulfidooxidans]|uniref:hypothetical protein n=1 Tax=Sulfobacillus thermosulfidooxidans TaxID=28034 RepID=UPI0004260651|nr:hypothetical protein [Sulfobacillus thermosulfidooxidans]OLZ11963.1 hypothetical protein BFX05_05670 [Sulfobacillus thermosulfidooxidans]OLZ17646.1 hypothetical protein BFX06_12915 [Sulfobacillus thermosulfidooxidans]OLZ22427.1 hypothetical protein BFX07_00285 [Sulfobacillus thermosulfidooxidans]
MKNSKAYLSPWPLILQAWHTQRLGHALVIQGSQEKADLLATALSRQMTCEEVGDRGCECRSCSRDIFDHPDVLHIQPEKDRIRREQLQIVLQHINRPPLWSHHLVIWVDQAHRLTEAAQNYLLKSLEEPPRYVTFILVTEQIHGLLPTVRSRCQFLRADPDIQDDDTHFDPDQFFADNDLTKEQLIQFSYWVRTQYRRHQNKAWLELWEASYQAFHHLNANGSQDLIKEILRDVFDHVRQ